MKNRRQRSSRVILVLIVIFAVLWVVSAFTYTPVLMFSEAANYCSDTDNGINFFVKGMVVSSVDTQPDRCLNENQLVEYYCQGTQRVSTTYSCSSGCVEGICAGEKKEWCSDSDSGMDPTVKGDVQDSSGEIFSDFCENKRVLREGLCQNNKIKIQYYVCPESCANGKCI